MDESALSYLNIQFTRSHAGGLGSHPWSCRDDKAKLVPGSGEASLCVRLWKRGAWAPSLTATGSPCGESPLWHCFCFPLHPTLEGLCCWGDAIWRQQQCLLPWLLTSPTWDRSMKSSLPKEVATPKSPSNERCTIRSRRGQNCPNSLWLRRGIFKGNIFMNQAKGKHCSPLQ